MLLTFRKWKPLTFEWWLLFDRAASIFIVSFDSIKDSQKAQNTYNTILLQAIVCKNEVSDLF
jgi:hypothetical protein